MKRVHRHRAVVMGATVFAVLCGMTGCYERVVGAKGLGASYSTIQPEYRSDTAADRAWDTMFNPAKPTSRSQRWVDPQ